MKTSTLTALALMLALVATVQSKDKRDFTDQFPLGDCTFSSTGNNPYFTLQVGRQLHFNNLNCLDEGDCDEFSELIITVTGDIEVISMEIDGAMTDINTRVVQEYETTDGELEEISRNYFAECSETQDVYYFGEEVDIYEDGEIVDHEGAWRAGQNEAQPGVIFPGGAFMLGARYYQEIAPEVALDRAEHTGFNLEFSVPAGDYDNCVEITETTPLEKHEESIKYYCHGTGLVFDDDLELVLIIE